MLNYQYGMKPLGRGRGGRAGSKGGGSLEGGGGSKGRGLREPQETETEDSLYEKCERAKEAVCSEPGWGSK